VQSVPITTKVVSSNPAHGEVYSMLHYVIKFYQWLATGRWFTQGIWNIVESGVKHHNLTPAIDEIQTKIIITLLYKRILIHFYCTLHVLRVHSILVSKHLCINTTRAFLGIFKALKFDYQMNVNNFQIW
jgi:hypothetical protein